MTKFLNLPEAVKFLGVSKSLLYKLTSKGKIKFFKPNNGKIYFREEDLLYWLKQGEIQPINDLGKELTEKIKQNGK